MCPFPQWDPMITTLPGLYLASVGLIRPVVWLADLKGIVVCSTAMLRFINLLFNSGNLYIIYLIICRLHIKDKVSDFFFMFYLSLLVIFPLGAHDLIAFLKILKNNLIMALIKVYDV